VQGDFSYSDEFYYNLRNFDADQFDSYTLVNAVFGWRTDDGQWRGNLGIHNLTDERAAATRASTWPRSAAATRCRISRRAGMASA
jgi:outer membrane receptor protein involved in Fe transport